MPARSPLSKKRGQRTRLRDIQQAMAGALMRPLLPNESMQPANRATAEAIIRPNERLTAFERLQIYNQQYWWRLLGNFGEDFHGLRAVIGPRKFDRLANAYLESCPSTSWSLRDLGSKLEAFVVAHPELVAPHVQLATEMVRVEWARVIAFDGPELPRIDAERVARTPAQRLKIGVQPYITLLELWHPIDHLLSKSRNAKIETASVSNAVAVTHSRRRKRIFARPLKQPIHLAVHRHDFSVYFKRLDPEAYRLLLALREGATLDDACARAFASAKELPQQSAQRIQEWFATWMRLGWLCARPR
jgi:hypothetical protein